MEANDDNFKGSRPLSRQFSSHVLEAGQIATSRSLTKSGPDDGELSNSKPLSIGLEEDPYDRFSPKRKIVIVCVVAYAALLAPFSSSSFLPSIPSICDELRTSAVIVDVSVAVFLVVLALAPLLWAPYCVIYGRKPIYVASIFIFTAGSMGVALCSSVATLFVTRIIQGIGSSAVLSIGAGTIGDIYRKEERGTGMGFFLSGVLIGPAMAPAIAGVLDEYVNSPYRGYGWRALQWLLFAMGAVCLMLVVFVLPETIHHRKIDDLVDENGNKTQFKDRIVFLNPLQPFTLLKRPHILAMSLTSSFVLLSTYCILVPLTQTVSPRYNIHNKAIIGLFYLAQGVGNIIMTQGIGRYADYVLRKWRRKRGYYVPEDRLTATLWGAGILLPGSVLVLGWVLDRVEGTAGIVLTVLLLVVDGMGLMAVLSPLNTYLVDVQQDRSAEVIATNNALRYLFSAGASAAVLPVINAIGVGATNTIAAAFCWTGFALIVITIRYGARMRAYGMNGQDDGETSSGDSDATKHA